MLLACHSLLLSAAVALTSPLIEPSHARVLLPIIFYLMLHKSRMPPLTRAAYAVLCVLAVLASLCISYADILHFLDEISEAFGEVEA